MNVHISHFPVNVLQHIFRIGVEQTWRLSKEYLRTHPPFEIVDEDSFAYLFKSDKERFEYHPNVLALMRCAEVCSTWADAVIDKHFWQSLNLGMDLLDLTEPWKLGRRWNEAFKDMPVHIVCSKHQAVANIGKISTSVQRGRCSFNIYIPNGGGNELKEAWFHLHSLLRYDCLHLKIISGQPHSVVGGIGFRHVVSLKWPRLMSLDVDSLDDIVTHMRMRRRLSRYFSLPADALKADPPFPALKTLCLSGNLGTDTGVFVPLVAPHLEHFFVNFTELEPYGGANGTRARTRKKHLLHEKFLEEEKRYRTFVTTFCMHAFKWPGPKAMNEYKEEWVCMSSDIFVQTGVMIFERREGKRCSLQLSVKAFFEVQDLRELHIPEPE